MGITYLQYHVLIGFKLFFFIIKKYGCGGYKIRAYYSRHDDVLIMYCFVNSL